MAAVTARASDGASRPIFFSQEREWDKPSQRKGAQGHGERFRRRGGPGALRLDDADRAGRRRQGHERRRRQAGPGAQERKIRHRPAGRDGGCREARMGEARHGRVQGTARVREHPSRDIGQARIGRPCPLLHGRPRPFQQHHPHRALRHGDVARAAFEEIRPQPQRARHRRLWLGQDARLHRAQHHADERELLRDRPQGARPWSTSGGCSRGAGTT